MKASHILDLRDGVLHQVCQFTPILRTNRLLDIVDGFEPYPPQLIPNLETKGSMMLNPSYDVWEKSDQYILSWFIATLFVRIVLIVYGLNTSRQVWNALSTHYASPSKSRVHHLRRQLQTLCQGTKTCVEFIHGVKALADQLALVGKPVGDEYFISNIVGGFNPQFNPFLISFSFATKDTLITFKEFQSELISYEQLLENQMLL